MAEQRTKSNKIIKTGGHADPLPPGYITNVIAGETEEFGEGDRVALIDRFDAQGADEIEISFSVSGIE